MGLAAWGLACGETSTQPTIDSIVIQAAQGDGGSGPKVNSTLPTGAPQGTEQLKVMVFGSGFDETSTVEFLLNRKSTNDIKTNSTKFVNDNEVVADITIAAGAAVDLFDVEVTLAATGGGRKRGIGIELFEVTGTTQECQIGFNLTFVDTKYSTSPVQSDIIDMIGTYENGVDKVQVGTGSGPGFRFDTNGNQKLEGKNDKRLVTLNFPSHDVENELFTFAGQNVARGIDLRFDKSDGGLNLCALNGPPTVPMTLRFAVPDTKDGYILRYGGTTVTGVDCGVDEVTVTRTGTEPAEWVLASGPTACLLPTHGAIMAVVAMPFAFTITAQP